MDDNLQAGSESESGKAESSNGSASSQTESAGTEPVAPPMDADTVDQWKRWTFSQIDNGRTEEEVTAELIAGGWSPGGAADLVEEMDRRAEAMWTRSALAQTPSAIFASRSRIPASTGRFSIVGSVANVMIAVYRMLFPDPEEELLPRKKTTASEKESPKPEK